MKRKTFLKCLIGLFFAGIIIHPNFTIAYNIIRISQKQCYPLPGPIAKVITSLEFYDPDGYNKIKTLIDQGANVNETFCVNRTALTAASVYPYSEIGKILNLLILSGANVNHKDGFGKTPLHYASRAGEIKTVKLLVENGAIIDVQTPAGVTALNHTGAPQVIEFLLSEGADPNLADKKGNSPLHKYWRETQPIKLLLDKGAKINAQNKEGSAPLHYVVKAILVKNSIFIKTAKFLIENGADPYLKDKSGRTPLDYIEDNEIKAEFIQFIDSLPK